jgi:squalene-hopene/tetraprenyl-beta-curcumene cyclase
LKSLAAFAAAAVLVSTAGSAHALEPERVRRAIERGRRGVEALQLDGTHWDLPSYVGTHYLSQYFLMLRWLGREQTGLDPAFLKRRLFEEQQADGSWQAMKDANLTAGDLNATVYNYWALKAMGLPTDGPELTKIRAWILAHGGLEKTGAFPRFFLALFGNAPWDFLPEVPYLLFNVNLPWSLDSFAQWVGPHLMPIAYLRAMQPVRDLGPAFRLDELLATEEGRHELLVHRQSHQRRHPDEAEVDLARFTLGRQQPEGSVGAYSLSTLLSIAMWDDLANHRPAMRARLQQATEKGFAFIEQRYFGSGESSYRGVVDDGHYWDTALMAIALQEAGRDPDTLDAVVDYLLRIQSSNGGFAFGKDFWYAPDTDDTAEVLLLLVRHRADPKVERAGRLALRWLERMQSADGGWGAFSKNSDGNWLLRSQASALTDSVDLFDESSPDVVGHILEAFGAWGYNPGNSQAVRRGVEYLQRAQGKSGAWWARWGINYVYGTGAAVVGLTRVGVSASEPLVRRALDWIEKHQNPDGGFGESSLSYARPELGGIGMSTPTQTAWALSALTAGGRGQGPLAANAAAYLVRAIEADGRWVDRTCVGTGHPGIIYMVYPSYPYAFPLTALARWAKEVGQVPSITYSISVD